MSAFDICRMALGEFYVWHVWLVTVIPGLPFC
jgi:hypothetical protein